MTFLEVTPVMILQLFSYVLFSDLAQKFYHETFVQYYLFVERLCRGKKNKGISYVQLHHSASYLQHPKSIGTAFQSSHI